MAAKENLVQWEDSYGLGLEQIDDQHKTLFTIMNRLWSAIVRRAEAVELNTILGELEQYTVSHFTAEETFMRAAAFSGFEEHKKQHEDFIARLQSARAGAQAGKHISLELLHFLRDWLVNHILVQDRAYADDYARAIQPKSFLGRFFSKFATKN